MDSQGVYHSRIFLNLFGKPVYSTIVAEKFQSYEVRITAKHICESKNSIWSFLLMSPSKTLPQAFIITPQSEGNYSFLPKSVFPRSFFLHNRKGGGGGMDYGVEKINKNKPVRTWVTSFGKFYHLCNFYFFSLFYFAII